MRDGMDLNENASVIIIVVDINTIIIIVVTIGNRRVVVEIIGTNINSVDAFCRTMEICYSYLDKY